MMDWQLATFCALVGIAAGSFITCCVLFAISSKIESIDDRVSSLHHALFRFLFPMPPACDHGGFTPSKLQQEIESTVRDLIAKGQFDGQLNQRFGLSPKLRRP